MLKALFYGVCLTTVAVFVHLAWKQYRTLLFPVEVELYVLDTRKDGHFAEDLRQIFPVAEQRQSRFRIKVVAVDKRNVNATEAQWQKALKDASSGAGSEMAFFQLPLPTTESKKILRAKIETQFVGKARGDFLRRTIALVGAHGENPSLACSRLEDDWQHADWGFGGIGLTVDDQTLTLIGPCLQRLLTGVFEPAA